MGSMDKNPDGVDADLATEDQLQSYPRAEADLAQLQRPMPLHPSMNRPLSARRSAWAAVLLTSLALTGCQTAMSSSANSTEPFDNMKPPRGEAPSTDTVVDWPLRFTGHWFAAYSYSTYGCKVKYARYHMDDPEDVLQLSSASIGDKYPNNLGASYGPIRSFPPPAVVTWRSKDGTSLRAEVDIAEIFKDRLIRHNLKREEVSTNASGITPGIILEVNDRAINVYMRAFISTKEEQRPGHPHSNYRNDLVKVFSQTY